MRTLPQEFIARPMAHRGLHDINDGRPENSRAAFQAAISHNYGIELDLQLSRDGRAMVFHDDDLPRLTNQDGLVKDYSAEALGQIALKGSDEGIPTLSEMLKLVDGRAPLLIELKDQTGQMGDGDGGLERAVAQEIRDYAGPVALMSFNPNMVHRLQTLIPERPRGIVTYRWPDRSWSMLDAETLDNLRSISEYDTVGACFISHDINDLDNGRVAEIKASGGAILCWTVRSAEAEAKARRVADNITFEKYLP